jgi:hypothetical protein
MTLPGSADAEVLLGASAVTQLSLDGSVGAEVAEHAARGGNPEINGAASASLAESEPSVVATLSLTGTAVASIELSSNAYDVAGVYTGPPLELVVDPTYPSEPMALTISDDTADPLTRGVDDYTSSPLIVRAA